MGTAEISEDEHPVGPGDFLAFPAAGDAHHLRNTGSEDLVYLMGGEKWATDIVHYPDIKRSMLKSGGRRVWADWADMQELPPRP